MSSPLKPSVRRYCLAVIFVSAILWWSCTRALAQQAPVTQPWTTTDSASPLLKVPEAGAAPSLEIVMADRNDLHRLRFHPGATNLRARSAVERHDAASEKAYSLLGAGAAAGSFLYEQKNEIQLKQWPPAEESATREVEDAPRPLFQLELGRWQIPVLLSSAASR